MSTLLISLCITILILGVREYLLGEIEKVELVIWLVFSTLLFVLYHFVS